MYERKMRKILTRALCLVWALALCLGCTLTALAAGESCEFCGGEIPEGIVICPHCWVCAECGAQNKENATVCADCGAQNAGGGASAPEEEPEGEGSGTEESAGEEPTGEYGVDSEGNPLPFPMEDLEEYGVPEGVIAPITLPNGSTIYWPVGMPFPSGPMDMRIDSVEFNVYDYNCRTVTGEKIYEYEWRVEFTHIDYTEESYNLDKSRMLIPGWVDCSEKYSKRAYDSEALTYDDEGDLLIGITVLKYDQPPIQWYDKDGNLEEQEYGLYVWCYIYGLEWDGDPGGSHGPRRINGSIAFSCYAAEGGFPELVPQEENSGSKSSGGNQIIQLEDGTYVTVDENGQINTDPSYSGIVQEEDGTYTNQTDTLPVPEYRDYEVGDIIMLAGVPFVLMLVAGVPTWVGPGGIGMDGQSLIPEDEPNPGPTEPDTQKEPETEPQEEPQPPQEPEESEVDKGREFAKYVTELRKENPWITQLTDLVVLANKQGLFKNAQGVKGFMEVYKGFMNYNDFIAQGDDPAFASVKTVITQGIQLAFSKEIGISDIALRAAQDQLMKSIQEFENLTGINTDHLGLRDMVTGAGKSISPGENIKQITNVSLDLMKECYSEFISRDSKSNLAGMVDDYRAGKYGENLKNMQLGIDLLSDLTEGKPVLEEIQEGYRQMGLDMMEEFTRRWTKQ